MKDWPCIVIAGPTATGKTALAVELAHALGSEIFSMDSRQVYRGLDLGTGKDLYEYRRFDPPVPFHLIDIVNPADVYSLFRFQSDCFETLENFRERRGTDVPPVLVGGTGLYLEAVLKRYDIAEVPEDEALREELSRRDAEELKAELKKRSPDLYSRVDLSNKRRIVRALEIALRASAGKILRSRLPQWNLKPLIFVTQWDRVLLRAHIEERLRVRLEAGMVEEVGRLHEQGLSWERLDNLGMEYRQIASFLRGEKSFEAMTADLLHEIRQLAKRQETWFRGMERRGLKTIPIGPDITVGEIIQRYGESPAMNGFLPGS